MEEDYTELVAKCIEFTNQFKTSSNFNFSMKFNNFSFTVNHSKQETQRKEKYVSPSNKRRNQWRLEAFLERKRAKHCGSTPSPSSEDAKLDTSQASNTELDTTPDTSTIQLSPNTANIVTYTNSDSIKRTKHNMDQLDGNPSS